MKLACTAHEWRQECDIAANYQEKKKPSTIKVKVPVTDGEKSEERDNQTFQEDVIVKDENGRIIIWFKKMSKENIDELIREYNDIISINPNYTQVSIIDDIPTKTKVIQREIDFEKFLERKFPEKNLFISLSEWEIIKHKFECEYEPLRGEEEKNLFEKKGVLKEVSFIELNYYQRPVRIEGLCHTKIDEPVLIIKYNEKLILKNGYHRSLIKIYQDQEKINGYILDIS